MTLKDFLDRVTSEDEDKMLIWKEDLDEKGWANIDIRIKDCTIEIGPDKSPSPFSSDR